MLDCYSLHFIQKIYHTIVKFWVDIGNKFAKFQCFDKERSPTACFFHSIKTKYVRNEKKKKNWKFYINTVKNVSTASHKLPHFLSEHVFIVKN